MQTDLLDRVRKLLAKAEDEGCTPEEAEALTAKAAELMARYGIDRALLGALRPETDRPADRKFRFEAPWADVKAHLLAALATALRCQCVQTQTDDGPRLHVFGYSSDLERAEILFTSLLVQMARALARQAGARLREQRQGVAAVLDARLLRGGGGAGPRGRGGGGRVGRGRRRRRRRPTARPSAALVLADRSLTVRLQVSAAYPRLKKKRVTYSGSGYGDGYREGAEGRHRRRQAPVASGWRPAPLTRRGQAGASLNHGRGRLASCDAGRSRPGHPLAHLERSVSSPSRLTLTLTSVPSPTGWGGEPTSAARDDRQGGGQRFRADEVRVRPHGGRHRVVGADDQRDPVGDVEARIAAGLLDDADDVAGGALGGERGGHAGVQRDQPVAAGQRRRRVRVGGGQRELVLPRLQLHAARGDDVAVGARGGSSPRP